MAFTWNTLGDYIDHDDFLEIKNNIETLINESPFLSNIPAFSWSHPDPDLNDWILANVPNELMNAVDHIDDENYCKTHDASNDIDVETGQFATFDNAAHSQDNNIKNQIECGNDRAGHNSHNFTTRQGINKSNVLSWHYTSNESTNNINHLYSNRGGDNVAVHGGNYSGYNRNEFVNHTP